MMASVSQQGGIAVGSPHSTHLTAHKENSRIPETRPGSQSIDSRGALVNRLAAYRTPPPRCRAINRNIGSTLFDIVGPGGTDGTGVDRVGHRPHPKLFASAIEIMRWGAVKFSTHHAGHRRPPIASSLTQILLGAFARAREDGGLK